MPKALAGDSQMLEHRNFQISNLERKKKGLGMKDEKQAV
jgi:hypothetical protein